MYDLDKMITEYLKKGRDTDTHTRHVGVFYASEMGKCPRAIFLNYKCPRVEFPEETLKIFHMGDVIHDLIKEIFRQNEFKFLYFECPANITDVLTPINIDGRIDIYGMNNDGKRFAVELKSIKTIEYLKHNPLEHHTTQLMLYLRAKRLKEGYISYIEKNTLATKTFTVQYEEEIFQRILDKAREVYSCLLNGKAPEKKPSYPSECSYCQFKGVCKKL